MFGCRTNIYLSLCCRPVDQMSEKKKNKLPKLLQRIIVWKLEGVEVGVQLQLTNIVGHDRLYFYVGRIRSLFSVATCSICFCLAMHTDICLSAVSHEPTYVVVFDIIVCLVSVFRISFLQCPCCAKQLGWSSSSFPFIRSFCCQCYPSVGEVDKLYIPLVIQKKKYLTLF